MSGFFLCCHIRFFTVNPVNFSSLTMKKIVAFMAVLFLLIVEGKSQPVKQNLVYIDKKGVLRYTRGNAEATFFGVNYTVPFAYGYRSHRALGIDPEKAIDADVNHMARLGLNAFRVHVWDVEISDSLGNLLKNEHLRLFDYLLFKLKQQNIKILITPIAFWGSGYPEPDVKTIGFASVYGKGPSVVREDAFRAQENYLKQFFQHINPYTERTYRDDPDVIAMEINNEPHHSGPRLRTTEYVNRMAAAVRSTGWTKPIFYNISESPSYAGAVAAGNVDGFSFQWYPTGLVANHERKGNFLPNVDRYHIPFVDTVPAFLNKARMVYEYDAGDVMQPVMYPAMARSFRTAGFQWATQFAYDPLYTAYGNTEYQTHYLNLVYTPAKAISLLIAAKAFHRLPRGKSYGAYPANTVFDAFRVSYPEQLSEMNSGEEFYYTASTETQPKNVSKLVHLAGVGSSPVVQYEGTGAYFLDKVAAGVWRLELMPDAIAVKDPFEKASPRKTVTRIQWRQNRMKLLLPEFDASFAITGATTGNNYKAAWSRDGNHLQPGVYFISSPKSAYAGYTTTGVEYDTLPSSAAEPEVVHQPVGERSAQQPFSLTATIAGIDTTATVSVELRHSANKWRTVPMQHTTAYEYKAEVPAEVMTPGIINYRIMLKEKGGDTYSFPGGFKGDPYAWDEYRAESWQTLIAAPESNLQLFDPATDRNQIMLYNPDWRNNTVEYITAGQASDLVWKATIKQPAAGGMMGFQFYFPDKVQGRKSELSYFTRMVVSVKASAATNLKVSLITTGADAYGAVVPVSSEWQDIQIPLSSLQQTDFLLLPRPYPGFQPLLFKAEGKRPFVLTEAERLEVRFEENKSTVASPLTIEVGAVWLMK
jgi:hypothetical protein